MTNEHDPVAVIGMSVRLPAAAFWELLRGGVSAIPETPAYQLEPACASHAR